MTSSRSASGIRSTLGEERTYFDRNSPELRADFVWRDRRVIVETDGHATHRTRQAFERDRRRDRLLTAAGWRVIRVTWRQLINEPEELVRTLRALMRL